MTHNHNVKVVPYDSFVKLEKKVFDKKENALFSTIASGIIVGQDAKGTRILTARHFCDDEDDVKDIDPAFLPLTSAIGVWDQNQGLHFVVYKAMDGKFDICLVVTDTPIVQTVIQLSPVPPKRGERVYNIAGPLGLSNGTTVLLFDGYYAGNLGDGNETFAALYSLQITNGSSGSGILNEHNELIGIVYGVMKQFDGVALAVPYSEVKRFLAETQDLPK